MSKFFKEHFCHFVLFVLEAALSYLHKHYDVYYDFDCDKFSLEHKKDGEIYEKYCF